jgi:hypothetical protein
MERWDWRDTWQAGADFALLGLLVTIASVPVVTLGAAVATGSVAAHHWCVNRGMPPLRELAPLFVRALLPGLGALAVAAGAAALLASDLLLLAGGRVPGGTGLLVLTWLLVAAGCGVGALTVVGVGARQGRGWRAAAGWAGRTALRSPWTPAALLGVLVVAAILGWMVPLTAPLLVGFALFALHVVTHQLGRHEERGGVGKHP